MGDLDRDFRLGDRRARPNLYEISGPDGTVRVESKSMAVLAELARHAGAVRTRRQLLDAVWGDSFVTEEVLSHAVWDLRRALGDSPRKPRFIQTIPRRGYRLIADVAWLEPDAGEFSRYRKIERIGEGVGGEVWKAEDRRLHRTVALKFLPTEWSRNPSAKERFVREARIVAALDHPNICTLHDLDETVDGRLFLVMGLYEGETVRQRLARGPLPWRDAAGLAAAVARGLACAHDAGIVHRDIKPTNLMLTADGDVGILDFGLARFLDTVDITRPEASPGTPAYMSPEQLDGDGVDHRCDLWSLGVVLYELLAGRRPFTGDNARAAMRSILDDDPPPLPDAVPEGLRRVVARALTKDPEARYSSADELAAALSRWSSGAPAVDPTTASPRPPASRRRRLLAAAAALLATVGLALGYHSQSAAPPELRIAVLEPAAGEALPALLPSGVHLAALEAISSLDGLTLIDPQELTGASRSAAAVARAVAADEVIRADLSEPTGGLVRISLFRIRGGDGEVLWSDSLEAPADADELRLVHEAVRLRLRRAYPERRRRGAAPELPVRDGDYVALLELKRQVELDGIGRVEDLDAVESVLRTSPGLLEAHLLGADIARALYAADRQPEHLERGRDLVLRAQKLAPHDSRPRVWEALLLLSARRHEEAADVLAELERQDPGSPRLPVLRSRLAEGEGRGDDALAWAHVAVERRPSWQRLYRLANLELRAGRVSDARDSLRNLLARAPDNGWGLAKLAELELLYGELQAAEQIYTQLLAREPATKGRLINLGLARLLQGRLETAETAFARAVELGPNDPSALLNLADVELALGRQEAARERYRSVITALGAGERSAAEEMLRAQCLVRLGQTEAAVRATQESLARAPDDPEVVYLASLVYALAGERTSCLVNARKAVEGGVQAVWFELSAFDSLRDDAAFKTLLAGRPAPS